MEYSIDAEPVGPPPEIFQYTLYDELRKRGPKTAVLIFVFFKIFNFLVTSAAGVVAVTVGIRMTTDTTVSAPLHAQYIRLGLVVSMLRATIIIFLDIVARSFRMPQSLKRELCGYARNQKKLPRVYVYRNGNTVCMGFFRTLYMCCGSTFLALVAIVIVCTVCSVLGGCLALFTYNDLYHESPIWVFLCGMTAGALGFTDGSHILPTGFHSVGFCWPCEEMLNIAMVTAPFAASYAAIAVVTVKVAKDQGHFICPFRTAAAAGAAFGATLVAGQFPTIALDVVSNCGCIKETSRPREPNGDLAEKLFPAPASERARTVIEEEAYKDAIKKHEADAKLKLFLAKAEELRKYPGMTKVFWSRTVGMNKVSHYVLIVGDHKYELRDAGGQRRKSDIAYATRLYVPPDDLSIFRRYSVYLIGWTNFTHEQINSICQRHAQEWRYSYLRSKIRGRGGNCQHFLRVVGDEIIADKAHRAMAWDWFRFDRISVAQQWELANLNLAKQERMQELQVNHVYCDL